MQELLREIDSVVGVRGAVLCNLEGEILATTLKGEVDPGTITAVARTFNRTFEGLRLARRRKVQEMDLVFEKGRLVVKNLPEGCLVVECVPNINVPLLNMTVNLVVRKLSQWAKLPGGAPATAAAAAPTQVGVGQIVIDKLRAIARAHLGDEGVEFFDREMKAAGLDATSSAALVMRLVKELDTPIGMAIGGRGARKLVEEMVSVISSAGG